MARIDVSGNKSGSGGAGLAVGVIENFTRANENPVLKGAKGYDPILVAGTWQVSSNKLIVASSAEARILWYTGTTDYVFTTTYVNVPGDGGIIWHAAQNIYRDDYWLLGAFGGTWSWYTRKAGAFSGGTSIGVAAANGDVVKITVHGANFVINVNAVDRVTLNDLSIPPIAFVGYRANNDAAGTIASMSVVPA